MIFLDGVTKSFGKTVALRNVSCALEHGKIHSVLGPNGSGKTTMLRLIASLLAPDEGSVRVAGVDVASERQVARERISLVGQSVALDPMLTVEENLGLLCRLHGLGPRQRWQRINELAKALQIEEILDRRVSQLSGGMARRVDLVASLIEIPQLLILDEPTTNLDPQSRLMLWNLIRSWQETHHLTVLLSTQYIEEAEYLADTVTILKAGEVIFSEPKDRLRGLIGFNRVVILPVQPDDGARIVQALAAMGGYKISSDTLTGRVTADIRAEDGMAALFAEFHRCAIPLAEFSCGAPSLQDAFLALTGDTDGHGETHSDESSGDLQGRRRKRHLQVAS